MGLLAHLPEGALTRKYHGRSTGTKPGVIVRSFSTDHAADGHKEATRQRNNVSQLTLM